MQTPSSILSTLALRQVLSLNLALTDLSSPAGTTGLCVHPALTWQSLYQLSRLPSPVPSD